MKIGYDAKRFFLNNTGLGNYSRWLVKSLATFYPDNKYLLYTPKVRPNKRLDFLLLYSNLTAVVPRSKRFTSWWRTKRVVKDLQRDQVEIYHGLSHELPFGIREAGIKSVLTVHDLIFMRFPQYYGLISRTIYGLKVKYACKAADTIIAISERTKNDIVELLNIKPEKIQVIYQGCDDSFKKTYPEEIKQLVQNKHHLPENFILSVGTVEERKNLLLLIEALPRLDDNINVVIIGKQTAYAKQIHQFIAANKLHKRVMFLQNISFEDLPVIYQMASVFVYPSRYEGFGIPILEALHSKVPVIAAIGSCLEEAGGTDSIYVDPDNAEALAKAIHLVLSNEDQRSKMISNGLIYAANFEDDKLTTQIMQIYKNLL